jgi:phosphopantothenoylcysteine decarboxylase/phosphopantothenate--cysteine ligase
MKSKPGRAPLKERAPEILVGVGASIAAYKAADVVSDLKKRGANVTVLLTKNAPRFVSPLALKVLSMRPVGLDLFDEPAEWGVGHVTLAKRADAFLIVGATADLIARLAQGMADDFVTTCALVATCPLILAPAMNTRMLSHPATVANMELLRSRGAHFVEPGVGMLACGDIGAGKLADPLELSRLALAAAARPKGASAEEAALSGKRVLVSAGPTREFLDPVRFISNPSSGKMGYALAGAFRDLGASVTLVSGPVSLAPPSGVKVVKVGTAAEMLLAVQAAFKDSDAFVSCAAVADFRPAKPAASKHKKNGRGQNLALIPNTDILLKVSKAKGKRVLVGFAAETEDLLRNAGKKLKEKNLDLIVANLVGKAGSGFESDNNLATLLWPEKAPEALPEMPKSVLAARVALAVAELL